MATSPGSRRRSTAGDVAALVGPFVVGALGSVPTARAIPSWYRSLDKPSWNPPDRVFGPVWTMLYALMGLALVVVRWQAGDPYRSRAHAVFALQLALNLAWSFVFFGGRDVRGGLAVIAMLWLAIVATLAEFGRVNRAAAALLLPYLGWVSFAAILNAEVARRNPA
jgi:translocator protein